MFFVFFTDNVKSQLPSVVEVSFCNTDHCEVALRQWSFPAAWGLEVRCWYDGQEHYMSDSGIGVFPGTACFGSIGTPVKTISG